MKAEDKSQTTLLKLFAFYTKDLKEPLKNFKKEYDCWGYVGQRMFIGDGMVSEQYRWQENQFCVSNAIIQVSNDAQQCQRKGRNCIYMLSISHIKMDDDDVIFLISTSRL